MTKLKEKQLTAEQLRKKREKAISVVSYWIGMVFAYYRVEPVTKIRFSCTKADFRLHQNWDAYCLAEYSKNPYPPRPHQKAPSKVEIVLSDRAALLSEDELFGIALHECGHVLCVGGMATDAEEPEYIAQSFALDYSYRMKRKYFNIICDETKRMSKVTDNASVGAAKRLISEWNIT
jgi:hypothetical protein